MGICAGVKSVSQNKSITPSSCWMLVTSDLLNVFHWTCFVLRRHDRRYIVTLDNYNNIVLNCISNTHSFLCSIFTYTLRFNFCNRFFKTATPIIPQLLGSIKTATFHMSNQTTRCVIYKDNRRIFEGEV